MPSRYSHGLSLDTSTPEQIARLRHDLIGKLVRLWSPTDTRYVGIVSHVETHAEYCLRRFGRPSILGTKPEKVVITLRRSRGEPIYKYLEAMEVEIYDA